MMKIILKRNQDDTCTIEDHCLMWLLHCTKDILEHDLSILKGHQEANLVEHNLKLVVDAIEFLEED
jgi:hypothetical protein